MPDYKPNAAVRLSAVCHENLNAICVMMDKPKGAVIETLAAGGIRAYMEGVAAQAEAAAHAEAQARAEDLALEDEAR